MWLSKKVIVSLCGCLPRLSGLLTLSWSLLCPFPLRSKMQPHSTLDYPRKRQDEATQPKQKSRNSQTCLGSSEKRVSRHREGLVTPGAAKGSGATAPQKMQCCVAWCCVSTAALPRAHASSALVTSGVSAPTIHLISDNLELANTVYC